MDETFPRRGQPSWSRVVTGLLGYTSSLLGLATVLIPMMPDANTSPCAEAFFYWAQSRHHLELWRWVCLCMCACTHMYLHILREHLTKYLLAPSEAQIPRSVPTLNLRLEKVPEYNLSNVYNSPHPLGPAHGPYTLL